MSTKYIVFCTVYNRYTYDNRFNILYDIQFYSNVIKQRFEFMK